MYTEQVASIICTECSEPAPPCNWDTGRYCCSKCGTTLTPGITAHALDRFNSITESTASTTTVKQVWADAYPILQDPRDWSTTDPDDIPQTKRIGHRFNCTEARFNREHSVVLLLRENNIVTIIDAVESRLDCRLSIVQTHVANDEVERALTIAEELSVPDHNIRLVAEREKFRRFALMMVTDNDDT